MHVSDIFPKTYFIDLNSTNTNKDEQEILNMPENTALIGKSL